MVSRGKPGVGKPKGSRVELEGGGKTRKVWRAVSTASSAQAVVGIAAFVIQHAKAEEQRIVEQHVTSAECRSKCQVRIRHSRRP